MPCASEYRGVESREGKYGDEEQGRNPAKLSRSQLSICDTTLRDGEQAAGIVFANLEKVRIAKLLDEIGVQQIEAGIPAMGGDEKTAVKDIAHLGLDASILGWNRANMEDIAHSIDCDVDSVAISMSSSDIHIEHKLMKIAGVGPGEDHRGDRVRQGPRPLHLRATPRTPPGPTGVHDPVRQDRQGGGRGPVPLLRYPRDNGASAAPMTSIKDIIEKAKIDIEMHTHNDFGMATANAIAGVQAGAKFVSTTVMGIGERTGNTPLEEIVMASKYTLRHGRWTSRPHDSARSAEYVARASGRDIPDWKPIVGQNCFAHEAGIHTDGVIKYLSNYEAVHA